MKFSIERGRQTYKDKLELKEIEELYAKDDLEKDDVIFFHEENSRYALNALITLNGEEKPFRFSNEDDTSIREPQSKFVMSSDSEEENSPVIQSDKPTTSRLKRSKSVTLDESKNVVVYFAKEPSYPAENSSEMGASKPMNKQSGLHKYRGLEKIKLPLLGNLHYDDPNADVYYGVQNVERRLKHVRKKLKRIDINHSSLKSLNKSKDYVVYCYYCDRALHSITHIREHLLSVGHRQKLYTAGVPQSAFDYWVNRLDNAVITKPALQKWENVTELNEGNIEVDAAKDAEKVVGEPEIVEKVPEPQYKITALIRLPKEFDLLVPEENRKKYIEDLRTLFKNADNTNLGNQSKNLTKNGVPPTCEYCDDQPFDTSSASSIVSHILSPLHISKLLLHGFTEKDAKVWINRLGSAKKIDQLKPKPEVTPVPVLQIFSSSSVPLPPEPITQSNATPPPDPVQSIEPQPVEKKFTVEEPQSNSVDSTKKTVKSDMGYVPLLHARSTNHPGYILTSNDRHTKMNILVKMNNTSGPIDHTVLKFNDTSSCKLCNLHLVGIEMIREHIFSSKHVKQIIASGFSEGDYEIWKFLLQISTNNKVEKKEVKQTRAERRKAVQEKKNRKQLETAALKTDNSELAAKKKRNIATKVDKQIDVCATVADSEQNAVVEDEKPKKDSGPLGLLYSNKDARLTLVQRRSLLKRDMILKRFVELRELLKNTDQRKFNLTYPDITNRHTGNDCLWCKKTLRGPYSFIEHICEIGHADKVIEHCKVQSADFDEWQERLLACQKLSFSDSPAEQNPQINAEHTRAEPTHSNCPTATVHPLNPPVPKIIRRSAFDQKVPLFVPTKNRGSQIKSDYTQQGSPSSRQKSLLNNLDDSGMNTNFPNDTREKVYLYCSICNSRDLTSSSQVVRHAFSEQHLLNAEVKGILFSDADFAEWERRLEKCQKGGKERTARDFLLPLYCDYTCPLYGTCFYTQEKPTNSQKALLENCDIPAFQKAMKSKAWGNWTEFGIPIPEYPIKCNICDNVYFEDEFSVVEHGFSEQHTSMAHSRGMLLATVHFEWWERLLKECQKPKSLQKESKNSSCILM